MVKLQPNHVGMHLSIGTHRSRALSRTTLGRASNSAVVVAVIAPASSVRFRPVPMHVLHTRAHALSCYASARVCIEEYVSLRLGMHTLHPIPPPPPFFCAPETMPLLSRSISRLPKNPHYKQYCASGNCTLRGRFVH